MIKETELLGVTKMDVKARGRSSLNSSMINARIEKLLNCFDSATRDALLDFCRRISSANADVFILMARKATCFFNCLEELGLIHFNGYVTSERILDMDTSWLVDKSIIIIDDAIVSGTSINRTISKLKKAGVSSVEVHVLSINRKWYQSDMLTDDEGNSFLYPNCNVASNEKCIELCYKIVKAILLQPRPYDIDYPFFSKIIVRSSNFPNILNRYGWNAFDVSTVEQKSNQIYSITLMPTQDTVTRFEHFVSCKAFQNCLLKIRLYATCNDKSKKTYSIRIVPMIVFDRIESKYIEQMFDELVSQARNATLKQYFTSVSSKMRALQFYFSYKLAIFWALGLPSIYGIKGSNLTLEERNLSFIFPKDIDSEIEKLCQFRDADLQLEGIFDFDQNYTSENTETQADKDYISIETKLIEPFIDFYYHKEIPCREIVLEEGKKVFENKEYNELAQRLNKGINIGELMHIIGYASDVYDIKTKVSMFLDRSIDMGIIVPITQEKDGCVYRAYRHGEDVLFGEREKILYLYLLKEFQNEVNNKNAKETDVEKGITHISLEKMIVLFTKIGLKIGVLHPYLLNFTCNPRDKAEEFIEVLRIKTTLKGPVALVGSEKSHRKTRRIPYISSESRMMWLSRVFYNENSIKADNSNKYLIGDVDTSSIVKADLNKVQDVAILFGQLCNKNINTGINYGDDELTKISTCLSLEDCIKAVAAELYIFTRHWHSDSLYNSVDVNEAYLDGAKESPYFEALNSAFMKVQAYESGEAKNLISKVSFQSRIEQNQWDSWFDDLSQNQENSELAVESESLLFECKRLLFSLLVLQNLLLESLFLNYKISNPKSRRYKYYFDCEKMINVSYKELKKIESDIPDELKAMNFVIDNLREMVDSACETSNNKLVVKERVMNSTIRNICHSIEICVDDIETLLDDVKVSFGERGQVTKKIIYNQVIAIIFKTNDLDFQLCVEKQVKRCYESILRKVPQFEDTNITLIPENYNPEVCILKDDEKALWMAITGNNSEQLLAIFSMNLFFIVNEECRKRNIRFGGLGISYFGDIGYQNSIKQSESSPTEFFCNSFYDYIDYMPSSLFQCEADVFRLKIALEQKKCDGNKFIEFVNSKQTLDKMNCKYNRIMDRQITLDNGKMLSLETYEAKVGETISKKSTNTPPKSISLEARLNEDIHRVMTKVGIITILEEEAAAVIKALSMNEMKLNVNERLYFSAQIQAEEKTHTVVMTQAFAQGNEAVAGAYNDMVYRFDPEIIILVGIAGGLSDDVDFGSVVLSHEIISYELRKDTPEGIQRRGRVNATPVNVLPFYQRLLRKIAKEPLHSYNSPKKPIHVIIGDIASGNAVIANELSEIRKWINAFNDKVVACEMEAYGVSSAFYEGQLTPNRTATYCVIRGISDMADPNKNMKPTYRKEAANNAAIVMKEFIKLLP